MRNRVGGLRVVIEARSVDELRRARARSSYHRRHRELLLLLVLLLLLLLIRLLVVLLRCSSNGHTIRIIRLCFGRSRKRRNRDGRRRVVRRLEERPGSLRPPRGGHSSPRQRGVDPFRGAYGCLSTCGGGAARMVSSRLGGLRRRRAAGDRGGVLVRSSRRRWDIFDVEWGAGRRLLAAAAAGRRLCGGGVDGASRKG